MVKKLFVNSFLTNFKRLILITFKYSMTVHCAIRYGYEIFQIKYFNIYTVLMMSVSSMQYVKLNKRRGII